MKKRYVIAVVIGVLFTAQLINYANNPKRAQLNLLKSIDYGSNVPVKFSTDAQCFNQPCNPSNTRAYIGNEGTVDLAKKISISLVGQGFIKNSGPPCNTSAGFIDSSLAQTTGTLFCQSFTSPSAVDGCKTLALQIQQFKELILYCYS